MTAEIIDVANELAEAQREQAIAALRINRNAVSAEYCSECCEDIPEPRRIAVPGCHTCASCQEEIEIRRRHRTS